MPSYYCNNSECCAKYEALWSNINCYECLIKAKERNPGNIKIIERLEIIKLLKYKKDFQELIDG